MNPVIAWWIFCRVMLSPPALPEVRKSNAAPDLIKKA